MSTSPNPTPITIKNTNAKVQIFEKIATKDSTKPANETTPLANLTTTAAGAITDQHLLLNTNLRAEQLNLTSLTPNMLDPTKLYNNHNPNFVEVKLLQENDIRNHMPLTFSLANLRGSWQSLVGNVTIKQRKESNDNTNQVNGEVNNDNKEKDVGSIIRCAAESYIQLCLPFTTNVALFSRYRLFETDRIRVGKLIEDLDALAADIAYKHIGMHSIDNYTIVTAGMDRISMKSPVSRATDIIISGNVASVGSTSMEVRLLVETLTNNGTRQLLMQGVFAMVCRHKKQYSAAKVPQLIPVTDYDKYVYQAGIEKREKRKLQAAKDLKRSPPTPQEIELIHKLYLDKQNNASNPTSPTSPTSTIPTIIPQSRTSISTVQVMHGQERNVHNKIFGGFLMQLALELASICAFSITAVFPILTSMDDVSFYFPVEIGSLLALRSTIQHICQERKLVFVIVVAEMTITSTVERPKKLTNEFHFCFLCDSKFNLPSIIPETYSEIVTYLDGRRREKELLEELDLHNNTKSAL